MKKLIYVLFLPILCHASENKLEKFLDLPVTEKYSYKTELVKEYPLISGDEGCYEKLIFTRHAPRQTATDEFENSYSLFAFDGEFRKKIFFLDREALSDVHYREDPVRQFDSREYRYLKIKSDKIKYKFKEEKVKVFGYVNHSYYPAKWTKVTIKKKDGFLEFDYKYEVKDYEIIKEFKCQYNI